MKVPRVRELDPEIRRSTTAKLNPLYFSVPRRPTSASSYHILSAISASLFPPRRIISCDTSRDFGRPFTIGCRRNFVSSTEQIIKREREREGGREMCYIVLILFLWIKVLMPYNGEFCKFGEIFSRNFKDSLISFANLVIFTY